MRLYYLIWVDVILKAKSQSANKNKWQVMTMIFMTACMAVDFLFLVTIFEKYIIGHYFYELEIPIIPKGDRRSNRFCYSFCGTAFGDKLYADF